MLLVISLIATPMSPEPAGSAIGSIGSLRRSRSRRMTSIASFESCDASSICWRYNSLVRSGKASTTTSAARAIAAITSSALVETTLGRQ